MEELVKLVLPFLSTPKNYAQVLKKLASFAFYETYLITLLLRSNPTFDAFATGIESWGPIGKLIGVIPDHEVLNLFGVSVAFIVAVLTLTFQFHDRISDLFGIRRRFDRKRILIPLAEGVGSMVTKDKDAKIRKNRDELMHAVFYKYVSSAVENLPVDKHDIEHALNAWSWFWVFVEAVVYLGVGAVIAWWSGSHGLARGFALASVVLLGIASLQRMRLGRYARAEVDSIVADPTAAYDVKNRFDAL